MLFEKTGMEIMKLVNFINTIMYPQQICTIGNYEASLSSMNTSTCPHNKVSISERMLAQ